MEEILYFVLRILGFIGAVWFFATVYGGKRPNILDEDIDKVSKGGPD
jgi:hypothetical protein